MAIKRNTAERQRQPKTAQSSGVPHSWEMMTWPQPVWPHDGKKGAWICRAYRTELVRAGAISRIGSKLIVLGRGYTTWLETHTEDVVEYRSNNPTIGRPSAALEAAK